MWRWLTQGGISDTLEVYPVLGDTMLTEANIGVLVERRAVMEED